MKSTFPLLLIIFMTISCKESEKIDPREKFHLKITARNFPDSTKVTLYNRDIDKIIDSTIVINESFQFSGEVDVASLCYLDFYDKNEKHLEPYKLFFLENKNIFITGEFSDFFNAKVKGSNQTDLLKEYDSISINATNSNRFTREIQFLYSNANNQMALNQLLYKKKQVSKDSLLLFYGRLDSFNSNSPKGQELLAYAKSDDIKVGDKFKDIVGKDLNGTKHKISDFQGDVILLDFWASGCIPCRLQNKKEFPDLIERFGNKGFIVISYSLDTREKYWKQSSEEDEIHWLNISDLKGIKGENVSKYAVQALPNSFLIDQNGVIVKSFVGFNEGSYEIGNEIEKLLR
ncbi:TlpA disulfide reductase family protein [Nonlabens agnitus]|uniref:Thioredoxin domain-containing protein n=1 Tax=Nonlabens agnitus TaxID=870484 RepID=A0A2S9WTI7_9FLAO|nr:TlpA disulfide reductase family protein [Nonlabens agnitus]PRP66779.1 hypothetical protein BST86_06535 [Nonlabens agnitus]